MTKESSLRRRGRWRRQFWSVALLWTLLASSLGGTNAFPAPELRPQVASGFSFSAGGDLGNTTTTAASLERLAGAKSSFFLALGDLSYEPPGTEPAWCDFVKSKVGGTYPFELLAGNHEDDGRVDGWIGDFVQCLPDRLNVTGVYGADYSFDYPSDRPLARFVLISPDLTLFGVPYRYRKGDDHYRALASRIDEARSAGIPWVIVGMHKVCLSTGFMRCQIGTELLNLLVEKRVDLILQGHDHTYQRSHQLGLSSGCPELMANVFNPNCIADPGADDRYPKAGGSVVVIDGAFGAGLSGINASDAEAPYFVRTMGWDTLGSGHGFTSFTVTATAIRASTNLSGLFLDAFSIEARPPSSVQALRATPGTGSLVLGWQAPASNGGLPITNYRIYRGTNPGSGTLLATIGPVFEYRDISVDAGTTYFYAVGAANVVGEGPRSEEVAATMAPAPLRVAVSAAPTVGNAPLSVSFTSTVTGGLGPYTYVWTFGDSETSEEANPVHSYRNPGDYRVSVIVTDSRGMQASSHGSVSIFAPPSEPGGLPAGVAFVLVAIFVGAALGALATALAWRWKHRR